MKVLVLCDRYPWPLTNGQNVRIYHYVRHLASKHEFHLGCYADSSVPDELRTMFKSIKTWPRPTQRVALGLRRAVEAFDVTKFIPKSPEACAYLASDGDKFDLVWVSGWDLIVNLPGQLNTPVLADAVDDGVLEYWRAQRIEPKFAQRLRLLKWVAMNALFERRYFGRAARVLFVSERDATVFSRICRGPPVSVVNIGVDETFFRPGYDPPARKHLAFVGNIGFAPNTDGVIHFVRDILPRIRARIPDVHFSIVGSNPPDAIRAMAGPNIEVTGFVEDVRPHLERASAFVCP